MSDSPLAPSGSDICVRCGVYRTFEVMTEECCTDRPCVFKIRQQTPDAHMGPSVCLKAHSDSREAKESVPKKKRKKKTKKKTKNTLEVQDGYTKEYTEVDIAANHAIQLFSNLHSNLHSQLNNVSCKVKRMPR